MIHQLNIKPEYFEAVRSGKKIFEYRMNDRGFQVGDFLALNEFDSDKKTHTGRCCLVEVTYILDDCPHLMEGYIIMSIRPCTIAMLTKNCPINTEKFFQVEAYNRPGEGDVSNEQ